MARTEKLLGKSKKVAGTFYLPKGDTGLKKVAGTFWGKYRDGAGIGW